eukprot:646754-Pelagomonas_calceolata.AAC.3
MGDWCPQARPIKLTWMGVKPSYTRMHRGHTWQMPARLNKLPATTVAWSVMEEELQKDTCGRQL